jgi:hypothetical protein
MLVKGLPLRSIKVMKGDEKIVSSAPKTARSKHLLPTSISPTT